MAWVNADVHSWSNTFSNLINEKYPDLFEKTENEKKDFDYVIEQLTSIVSQKNLKVLEKLKKREKCSDGDLCGIKSAGLLVLCWKKLREVNSDGELKIIFDDLLNDIGGTCLQGDTHRLFSLYVAVC